MCMHLMKAVSCALRHQLCQIHRSVPVASLQMLVVTLVHSQLDYGNAMLVGIPAHLQRHLQSVLNVASQLIYYLGFPDHVTNALISLH